MSLGIMEAQLSSSLKHLDYHCSMVLLRVSEANEVSISPLGVDRARGGEERFFEQC